MDFDKSAEYFPEDFTDNSGLDNEVCEICLDVVIDRGLLDCCDHWFCFACIDNWATITNLCPICKKEFQLITCLPVFDPVENDTVDEHSLSRFLPRSIVSSSLAGHHQLFADQDLHVEGRFDTLSFPSYYIDEDAVVCLDGDGCKIRGGLPTEESVNIDTSIACDSCDVWYHAFCVGFDPEDTSHSSWLCPRCIKKPSSRGSDKTCEQDLLLEHDLRNPCAYQSVESFLSGRVSVSIADPGETDIVISLIDGKKCSGNEESLHENTTNISTCLKQEILMRNVSSSVPVFDQWGNINVIGRHANQLLINNPERSRSVSEFSPVKSSAKNSIINYDKAESVVQNKEGNAVDLVLEIPESKSSSVSFPSTPVLNENQGSDQSPERAQDLKATTENGEFADDEKLSVLHQKHQNEDYLEIKTQLSASEASPKDIVFDEDPEKEVTSDIMSIVQSSRVDEKFSGGGLRVKKILWKSADDDKSSSLIQKLRREIKDAVCDKNISDISKVFEGKLLSAFRAAISRSESKIFSESNRPSLRRRNILLQRGKVRENLTKKVYATSSGRRRRAWDRDRAVEFWKHQQVSNEPEKVKTLESVLEILRKLKSSVFNPEADQDHDDSLHSRLYLADTSVLPRTDNLKPLSVLDDANGENHAEATQQNKKLKSSGVAPAKDLHYTVKAGTKGSEKTQKHQSSYSSSSSKSDKRQWALEVLARKSSFLNPGTSQSREEDQSLKGSYPLLAQLPTEMRPVPIACSHNKIPMPVRQAQVYRLAEQYLKRIGIPIIHTAAEVELAVADAVNIEKVICERSKSKLVYMNLCSQRATHKDPRVEKVDSDIDSVDAGHREVNADNNVDEMLKLAGLLSDSPPNSPSMAEANVEDESISNSRPDLFIQDVACEAENQPEMEMVTSDNCEVLTKEENSGDEQIKALCNSRVTGSGSSVAPVSLLDGGELKIVDDTQMKELGGENCEETSLNDSQPKLHSTGCLDRPDNPVESCKKRVISCDSSEEITMSPISKMTSDGNQIEESEEERSLIEIPGKNPSPSKGCLTQSDNPDESSIIGSPSSLSAEEITRSPISKMGDGHLKTNDDTLMKELDGKNCEENPLNHSQIKLEGKKLSHSKVELAVSDNCDESTKKEGPSRLSAKEITRSPISKLGDEHSKTRGATQIEESEGKNSEDNPSNDSQIKLPGKKPSYSKGCLANSNNPVGSSKKRSSTRLYAEEITRHISKMLKNREGTQTKGLEGKNCAENSMNDLQIKLPRKNPSQPETLMAHSEKPVESTKIENSLRSSAEEITTSPISKMVEAYIKEHIRPLCKSGVITVEQYRWAIGKTTEKVMKYHAKAKDASFLIKEGDKVKKLAEEYVAVFGRQLGQTTKQS